MVFNRKTSYLQGKARRKDRFSLACSGTLLGIGIVLMASIVPPATTPVSAAIGPCGELSWPAVTFNWPQSTPEQEGQPVKIALPPGRITLIDGGATQRVNASPPLVATNPSAWNITIALDNGWKGPAGTSDALVDITTDPGSSLKLDGPLPAGSNGVLDDATKRAIVLDRLIEVSKYHTDVRAINFQIYRADRANALADNLEVFVVTNIEAEKARLAAEKNGACATPAPSPSPTTTPRPVVCTPLLTSQPMAAFTTNPLFLPIQASGSTKGAVNGAIECREARDLEEAGRWTITPDPPPTGSPPDTTLRCDGVREPTGPPEYVQCQTRVMAQPGSAGQALTIEYLGSSVAPRVINPHPYLPVGQLPANTKAVELSLRFLLDRGSKAQALEFGFLTHAGTSVSEAVGQWNLRGSSNVLGWRYWTGCASRRECTSDEEAWKPVGLEPPVLDGIWHTLVVRAEVSNGLVSKISCLNANGEVRTIAATILPATESANFSRLDVFFQPDGNYDTAPGADRSFSITVDQMGIRTFNAVPSDWNRCQAQQ